MYIDVEKEWCIKMWVEISCVGGVANEIDGWRNPVIGVCTPHVLQPRSPNLQRRRCGLLQSAMS